MKSLSQRFFFVLVAAVLSACSVMGTKDEADGRTPAGAKREVTFYEEKPGKKDKTLLGTSGLLSAEGWEDSPLCKVMEKAGIPNPLCPRTSQPE